MQREILNYDVLIIGAGPSGLASAIKLKQLPANSNLSIAILEKGSSVGANIISGCIMDPIALNELLSDWETIDLATNTKVTTDNFIFLTNNHAIKLPIPQQLNNKGNYIISLGQLCKSLAKIAESMGVEIYPSFAAISPVIENNCVVGVITDEAELRAKQLIIAEGCHGSLAKQIISRFGLDKNSSPQTYGLGIKEIWQINHKLHQEGMVNHFVGYPLNGLAYGGGFLYHQTNNLISIGLVTALDYKNPYLSPYEEFQRFKQHPEISRVLNGGKRIEYGARTVVEGGVQSLPHLTFPGGVIVGDSAGFLNIAKIKGVHNAIKSGMLAAEAVTVAIQHDQIEAISYTNMIHSSWLYKELYKVRNIRPAFCFGLYIGLIYAFIDCYLFRGKTLWTFKNKRKDNQSLQIASLAKMIHYPKHDGITSFDISSSLHLTNLLSSDKQDCHLHLKDSSVPIKTNLAKYASPETRYCPASVYQIIGVKEPYLEIHAQNCIQCKACDIKDPTQNITWNPPKFGNGPQYSQM